MKRVYLISILMIIIMIFVVVIINKKEKKLRKKTFTSDYKKQAKIKRDDLVKKNKRYKIDNIKKNIFKNREKLTKESREKLLKDITIKLVNAQKAYNKKVVNSNNKQDNKDIYTGVLSKKYLKKQIKEIVPEVKNCYTESLKDDSSLAGKLTLEFIIIGDPDLGAMIEKSDILTNTMNSPEKFNNCVLDSLYKLKLEAPEDGGKIRVKYPFNFAKEDKE